MVKIAPSILPADFARLGDQVTEAVAAGADWIHIDVMDGQFVPNITLGPLIVEAVRRYTNVPLDVHLMIVQPERYLTDFAQAGANHLIVHAEACPHLHRTVEQIKEIGLQAGVAINPATPLVMLEEILPFADHILIMSVNPGFGGQHFIPTSVSKVARLHALLQNRRLGLEIELDGGIDPQTAPQVVKAGATVLVAGSALFNQKAPFAQNMEALRRASVPGIIV